MTALSKRVQVDTRSLVDITEVSFSAVEGGSKEKVEVGDTVEVALDYETREKIDDPIFNLSIIRADGVLCCSSRTDHEGVKIGTIEGKGKVKINLGKTLLTPGIYMLKLSVWDEELIHAYTVRDKDVLRVETDKSHRQTGAVFLPEIKWEFKS